MKKIILLFSVLGLLAACSDEPATGVDPQNKTEVVRSMDFAAISRGGQLFQQNCAVCHGQQAQGLSENWRQADQEGKLPPPPLNGTAHAWHHPKRVLVSTIKNGTAKLGGNMPGWEGKLNDAEINSIIAWFQSKWSDEIYAAWYKRDQEFK